MTDAMLVREYAASRSREALAELVARHLDWVYSAALRMVGDAELAADVTQGVFLVLTQKAAGLEGKPVNAWLFGVTRFAARHALRERSRRRKHERMAAIMIGQSDPQAWEEIAPLLDEMVGRLNGRDRRAVLLRFYESKSMADVGVALGVSEDAAKKRVAKAIKRLRELLAGRGIKVPGDVLGILMLNHAASPAPPKLAARCMQSGSGVAAGSIANGVMTMMTMTKIKMAAVVIAAVAAVPVAAVALLAATTQPAANVQPENPGPAVEASDLYVKAAASLTVDSPAATSIFYPELPIESAQWHEVEAAAWQADATAQSDLVHQARAANVLNLPANLPTTYYNPLRNLANHIGDSAMYASAQGNDAAGVDLVRDLMHMGDLIATAKDHGALPVLVGGGIKALALNRLEIIASGVKLTNDPANSRDLQTQVAGEVIADLLDAPNLKLAPSGETFNRDRALETQRRVYAEHTLAAISLAAHLYKFDKGHWPESIDDLVPAYLPQTTVDPWGNGRQIISYALIKGGLPDGSDRPLAYDRGEGKDGLYYPANRVAYGFYNTGDHGTKFGGEFRDITRWEPAAKYTGPAQIALPAEVSHSANPGRND